MKISFLGAAKEVTGSCFLLTVGNKNVLIDCGMQQGQDKKDNQALVFDANKIDYVVVTHAHIDHSGRLPLLTKNGYKGQIHATRKTCDLMRIMLMDSAHIQMADAEWENRKSKRSSKKQVEPLYTTQDVEDVICLFCSHEYNEIIQLDESIKIRFTDAGHLLGSSSIEVFAEEKGITKKIVFSGDIGNSNQPIIRDPQYINKADYVITESTYGDRIHEQIKDHRFDLAKIIDDTFARGGNVIFPAFAVGRTQELLYFIREIKEQHLVKNYPDFKVYVDSPLASEATKIYDNDLFGYADAESIELIKSGYDPLKFDGLKLCQSVEESRWLNTDSEPKVIISASGMCDAGRIRHHLKHNLWRAECSVVFVGFQAHGTLGRILVDGVPSVKLFGEEIAVKAHIHNFKGLSAHGDLNGLLEWIKAFENVPKHIFVVHGESKTAEAYAQTLNDNGFAAHAPNWQEVYDLLGDTLLASGVTPDERAFAKDSQVFKQLQTAGIRLNEVISQNRHCTNKDIIKFTRQVLELAEKWKM